MNIEYTLFKEKSKHSMEWDDGFNNCLIFHKREGFSVLSNFITGQSINFDFNPSVSSLTTDNKINEVWLGYCKGGTLRLYNFINSSFVKSFDPIEGLDWNSRLASPSQDFILATDSGLFYIFDVNEGKVILEDLIESDHRIRLYKKYFVDYPTDVYSNRKSFFKILDFESGDEVSNEIQITNYGYYIFICFFGNYFTYLNIRSDSLAILNKEGQILNEIHFKVQKGTSIVMSVVGDELFTITKEGRNKIIRKFDKDCNLQSESNIEIESTCLNKSKENPQIFKAGSYKNFIWLENSLINTNDFSVETLNLPETIDWNVYDYKISENGVFFIGLINPRTDQFDKYLLGSFEEGLIHPNFKNCSEIKVIESSTDGVAAENNHFDKTLSEKKIKFVEELKADGFFGNAKPNDIWINSKYEEFDLEEDDKYSILAHCISINFQDTPLTDFMEIPDEEVISESFSKIQEWLSENFKFDSFSVTVFDEEERFNFDIVHNDVKYSVKDGDLNATLWILSALLNEIAHSGNSFFLTETCQLFYCSSSAKTVLEEHFDLEDLSRHKKYTTIQPVN